MHKRASTSLGGPVDDLELWTTTDVRTMGCQRPSIYNRHPLVSELIYGPIRAEKKILPPFTDWEWVTKYRRDAAQHAVLVVCQPPYYVVQQNLHRSGPHAHMPGVYENQAKLYTEYRSLVWPGPIIRYDYRLSRPEILAALIRKTNEWSPDL
jgi:hypothetical protein